MSQQSLNHPKVGPALQKMGRERMSKHMRGDRLVDAGRAGIPLHDLPKPLTRHAATRACHKDTSGWSVFQRCAASAVDVPSKFLYGHRAEMHQTLFRAFGALLAQPD